MLEQSVAIYKYTFTLESAFLSSLRDTALAELTALESTFVLFVFVACGLPRGARAPLAMTRKGVATRI
ncbi:hypothetical protein [Helicobacter canis]|uniref:hypothetical protein n=1 Tax=Helicobacter canis TaxID=29419 RepID=UPI0026EC0282|nr:hypothetical protein [Helicobacter canis]